MDSDESDSHRGRRRRRGKGKAAAEEEVAVSQEEGTAALEVTAGDKGYVSSDATTTTTTSTPTEKEKQRTKKTVTWDEAVIHREQRPKRKDLMVDLLRSSDESAESDDDARLDVVRKSVSTDPDAESENQSVEPVVDMSTDDAEGGDVLGKARNERRGAGGGATSPVKKALSLPRTNKKHSWCATDVARKARDLDGTIAEEGPGVSVKSKTEIMDSEYHKTTSSEDDMGGEDGLRRRLRRCRTEGRDGTGGRGSSMSGVRVVEGSPKLRASRRIAGNAKEVHTEQKAGHKLQVTKESSEQDQPVSTDLRTSRTKRVAESPKQDQTEEKGSRVSRVVESPKQDQAGVSERTEHNLQNCSSPSLKYNLRKARNALHSTDSNDDTESDDKSRSIGSKSASSKSSGNLLSPDKYSSPLQGGGVSSSSTPTGGSSQGPKRTPPQGKASTAFISKRTLPPRSVHCTVG